MPPILLYRESAREKCETSLKWSVFSSFNYSSFAPPIFIFSLFPLRIRYYHLLPGVERRLSSEELFILYRLLYKGFLGDYNRRIHIPSFRGRGVTKQNFHYILFRHGISVVLFHNTFGNFSVFPYSFGIKGTYILLRGLL